MSENTPLTVVAVGEPLLHALDLCWTARRSPLLIGGTGVGKSSTLEQFAAKRKIDFISRDLSIMEPPDLVGLPTQDGDRTRFRPPAFLPSGGDGILVLEELNRAPNYMRAPALQLLTARTLNDYMLPDGWLCAAAVNPAEEGYEVETLDLALLTRFVQLHVRADSDEWLAWARAHNIHADVMGYVESEPSVFECAESNPRAWTNVSELLKAAAALGTPPLLLEAAVEGCVGAERATAFFQFRKRGVKPFKAREVFAAYASHGATLRAWVTEGKLDLVEATLLDVQKRLQATTDFEAVRKNRREWANLSHFLADLPGDLCDQAAEFFREHDYQLPKKLRRPK
jgi:hypothetical protein